MIRIGPGPSLRALEPRLLLGGCSLNTIFRGPTSAHNPPFAAATAVIKDWGRGSRKWAQTPCVNPVCACGRRVKEKKKRVHVGWTLAFTCVLFCVFLAQEGKANSWPPLHTPPPTHQTPQMHPQPRLAEMGKKKTKTTKKIIKQLELSPLVRSTFGASPPAGVEQEKEKEAGPG